MASRNAAAATPTRRSTRQRRQVASIYDDARAETEVASSGPSNQKKIRVGETSPFELPIFNLPDPVLLNITSFVDSMSKVLLAVALTASSDAFRESNWKIKPCAAAKSILNQRIWCFASSINFRYTDKELASRLTDEDVGGIISCVGAVFDISEVRVTNCVNITGRCLETLLGCKSLRSLDLGFVNTSKKAMNPHQENKISEKVVVPILNSILDSEECALGHIQFPKQWREEHSQQLREFILKHNRAMNKRSIPCRNYECQEICSGTARRPWISKNDELFGTYNFTCYECHDSFCIQCNEEKIPDALCERCETRYCVDCYETLTCDNCLETTCYDCTWIGTCQTCNKTACDRCCPVVYCENCGKTRCAICIPSAFCRHPDCVEPNCFECSDEYYAIKCCYTCQISYCGEHLMQSVIKDSDKYCSDCQSRAALNIFQYNKSFGTKVQELESKYSTKGRDCWTIARGNFSQSIEARDELLERYHAVGMLLLPKQKQFERYDSLLSQYESNFM